MKYMSHTGEKQKKNAWSRVTSLKKVSEVVCQRHIVFLLLLFLTILEMDTKYPSKCNTALTETKYSTKALITQNKERYKIA